MSSLYPDDCSSPTRSSTPLPDYAALVKKLQEAAQALRTLAQPDTNGSPSEPAKTPDEIRSYRVPGFIVDKEKFLLNYHKAGSWQEMFSMTYDRLFVTVMLMQNFPAEEEIDGFTLQLIAESLMMPLGLLNSLCAMVADFRPPEEETVLHESADFHS